MILRTDIDEIGKVLDSETILEDSEKEKVKEENVNNSDEDKNKNKIDSIENLQNELKIAKDNAEKSYDSMLRSKAEFENYKKRMLREIESVRKYSLERILKEQLVIVDNLERAINSIENNDGNLNGVLEGIKLTLNETFKILENNNVSPIESVGKEFDPKFHQAMSQEETDDFPENTVIRELLKGYLIHDRLLRPTMVVVSKKIIEDEI